MPSLLAAVMIVGLLTACGGSSGSGPTSPAAVATPAPEPTPISLTVVSGETGEPVVGATVRVDGSEQTSGTDGGFTVAPGARESGTIDIVANGFLDRQTTLGRALVSGQFSLWPRISPTGLDEKFTQEIVYTEIREDPVLGDVPLQRWRSSLSPIRVVFGQGFEPSMGRSVDNQVDAVAQMNDLLGSSLRYLPPEFSDDPPEAGVVNLRIDPDDETCNSNVIGLARRYVYANREIGRVDIIYCSVFQPQLINLVSHEFGHSIGLQHSFDDFDLMFPYLRSSVSAFSGRERLVVRLIYQRPTGNLYPDNDRESTATTAGWARIETIICGP